MSTATSMKTARLGFDRARSSRTGDFKPPTDAEILQILTNCGRLFPQRNSQWILNFVCDKYSVDMDRLTAVLEEALKCKECDGCGMHPHDTSQMLCCACGGSGIAD